MQYNNKQLTTSEDEKNFQKGCAICSIKDKFLAIGLKCLVY